MKQVFCFITSTYTFIYFCIMDCGKIYEFGCVGDLYRNDLNDNRERGRQKDPIMKIITNQSHTRLFFYAFLFSPLATLTAEHDRRS